MMDLSWIVDIPGLGPLVDGVITGGKWILKYGRSKNVLILGQGRCGKTSIFEYIKGGVINECHLDLPMTRTVPNKERMFHYNEDTPHGRIDVEIRRMFDLSGQGYPDNQANEFKSHKPHVLFVFMSFINNIDYKRVDQDNVAYWLDEFFGVISESPRAFKNLVHISFVVTKIDLDIPTPPKNFDERKKAFEDKIDIAFNKIPHRARRDLKKSVYFLSMCCNDRVSRENVRNELDKMLTQSFVRV